jgi:hypothetical protein
LGWELAGPMCAACETEFADPSHHIRCCSQLRIPRQSAVGLSSCAHTRPEHPTRAPVVELTRSPGAELTHPRAGAELPHLRLGPSSLACTLGPSSLAHTLARAEARVPPRLVKIIGPRAALTCLPCSSRCATALYPHGGRWPVEVRHKPEEGEVGDEGWTPRVIDMERGLVGGVFWAV